MHVAAARGAGQGQAPRGSPRLWLRRSTRIVGTDGDTQVQFATNSSTRRVAGHPAGPAASQLGPAPTSHRQRANSRSCKMSYVASSNARQIERHGAAPEGMCPGRAQGSDPPEVTNKAPASTNTSTSDTSTVHGTGRAAAKCQSPHCDARDRRRPVVGARNDGSLPHHESNSSGKSLYLVEGWPPTGAPTEHLVGATPIALQRGRQPSEASTKLLVDVASAARRCGVHRSGLLASLCCTTELLADVVSNLHD